MFKEDHKLLCQETGKCVVLAKVDSAARELTSGSLIILLRRGEEILEVRPGGRKAELPSFCEVYRATPEGRKRCLTCRSLMTFGACYRGLIVYSCHGGVSIIAAAAPTSLGDGAQPVVASSAFAAENRKTGWQELQDHSQDLGIDLKTLRHAYNKLPQLTNEIERTTRALVDIAAGAIGEIVDRLSQYHVSNIIHEADQEDVSSQTGIENLISSSLYISREDNPIMVANSNGVNFIQLVIDMVNRNPEMPFSVENIARAAHITPNYFSAVFKKHAGQSFSDFIIEKRITRAKYLLRDLALNVGEVAASAGFNDCSYFNRRFKQKTGMTPMMWRNTL